MQIRRAEPPASRFSRVIARSERCGQLGQARAGGRRPPSGGVIGRRVQFCRGDRVRPLGSERQMTGSLLHVSHRPGQQSVRRPAFLRRRLLIADGCQQRVDEAHALAFKHEDPLTNGDVEPIADGIGAAEDGNDELDRSVVQPRPR